MNRIVITVAASLLSAQLHAAPIFDWDFDAPLWVVGPNESVNLTATITNISSTAHVLPTSFSAFSCCDDDIVANYALTSPGIGGGPAFSNQFIGLDLAPGQSFTFVFVVLNPLGGGASPGTHTVDGCISQALSGTICGFASNNGINRSATIQVVPLPMVLFPSAILVLSQFRRNSGFAVS